MTGSSPVPVEERSLAVSTRALTVSRLAMWASVVATLASVASVVTGVASCQQAQTANQTLQAGRAANVYFDTDVAPDGTRRFLIVNRNTVPVHEVSYDYRVGESRSGAPVFVGLIPACTSVQARPQGDAGDAPGYKPTNLYLRDIDGNEWTRDESGRLSRTDINVTNPAGDIVAKGEPLRENC